MGSGGRGNRKQTREWILSRWRKKIRKREGWLSEMKISSKEVRRVQLLFMNNGNRGKRKGKQKDDKICKKIGEIGEIENDEY
jgi:hypothetical protein